MRTNYLVVPALVLLLSAFSVEAQARTRWVKFSPPDKSFSIVLPRKPIYQHSDLNYDEQGVFDGNMRADDYDFSPNDSGTTSLITVFHLARPKSRQQFDKECDSIMEVIAGDDKQFDKRASLTINGLHAREYLFRKGSIRGRVLIVNARTRIYFLQYHTETGVLPSFVAGIFRSFRVAR
jgi:hypothetical protein